MGCLQIGLGGGGGSSGDSSADDSDEEYEAEEGSCNGWKVAYCEAVDLCGSVEERTRCHDAAGYVVCKSDAAFASCQTKLEAIQRESECSDWPEGCEPSDLADPTDAFTACRRVYRGICEWRQYCNPLTTVDDCEAEMETQVPCSSYYAVNADVAETCIAGYQVVGCGEYVPNECITDNFLFR